VAKPQRDHAQLNAGLQQVHRRGVPDRVRRHRHRRQFRVRDARVLDGERDALRGVRARHERAAPRR